MDDGCRGVCGSVIKNRYDILLEREGKEYPKNPDRDDDSLFTINSLISRYFPCPSCGCRLYLDYYACGDYQCCSSHCLNHECQLIPRDYPELMGKNNPFELDMFEEVSTGLFKAVLKPGKECPKDYGH